MKNITRRLLRPQYTPAITFTVACVAYSGATDDLWGYVNRCTEIAFYAVSTWGVLMFISRAVVVRRARRYLASNPFAYLALARMQFGATEYGAPTHTRTATVYCPPPCGAPLGLGHEHISQCPRYGE